MPNWLIKSAIQHVLAVLPRRQKWNHFFQRYGTKSLQLGEGMFERRLEHCRTHLENFYAYRTGAQRGFTALELGTGWFPTMAVGLYLCGAEKIWTIDIDPLLHRPQIQRMLELYFQYADRKALEQHLPRIIPERLERLRELAPKLAELSPEAFLRELNIHHMVRDAQQTGLAEGSVDLIFSTGVLEYIPAPVLKGIFKEFRRISSSDAVMSHWISMIDQFWYFDRNITPFNYMKYTAKQWSYFNSPLIWQSRLRIPDYRRLLAECGFRIEKEVPELGEHEQLQKLALAPEFRKYSIEDLVVVTSWVVTRPV